MNRNKMVTVNQEKIGQNFTDENGVEWIWVADYREHAMKYEYDEELNEWSKLNEENLTYEPLIEIHEPRPTAEMGKYGILRLKFIWQTPCLIEAIMLNGDITQHCEEMNEKVLELMENIIEKKKQSDEYKAALLSGKYLQILQLSERYRKEAEEEILPVTVYAI